MVIPEKYKKIITEMFRMRIQLIVILISAFMWGFKDYLLATTFIAGFVSIGVLLGHLASKETFRKYKWDVGEKLNEAWGSDSLNKTILAVGMLIARVLIYVAIIIAMAIALVILRGKSADASIIPQRSLQYIPILVEEHSRIWPTSDICVIAEQITHESAWKTTATRKEKSGVISYGLLQVLDRTMAEMQTKHQILMGLEPVQMLQARWGLRAGILYDKDMWKLVYFAKNPIDRYAFMLASYNGGYGWVQRDRKLTVEKGYNRDLWFNNVELFSTRSQWAFGINRKYVSSILLNAPQWETKRVLVCGE